MKNKGNRFLSTISTILIFLLIAALYVVPSIEAMRSGTDVATLSSPASEAVVITDSAENTEVEAEPVVEVVEEKKEEITTTEEDKILHVHRDIKIEDYHFVVDAYDGYGFVKLPSNLSEADIYYGITVISNSLGDISNEINFLLEPRKLSLSYNQGHSESEINTILDMIQNALGAVEVHVPATPNLQIEKQGVKEELKDFLIKRTLYALDIPIEVVAQRGIATFSYPTLISQSDVANSLSDIFQLYSVYGLDLDCELSDGKAVLYYSENYEESDILVAISVLESYLKTLTPTQEAEEAVKVPTKAEMTFEQELVFKPIYRSLETPFGLIDIIAYNSYATLEIPEYIVEEDIATALAILSSEYSLTDFDFAIDKNIVEATYSPMYSDSEINSFIDSLEEFLASYQIPVAEVLVPSKPKLEVVQELNPWQINRTMFLFDDIVNVDAYSGYATFVFPEYVDDESIANGIVDLLTLNYPVFSDFDFAIGDEIVATYSEDYSEKEINSMLDRIEELLLSIERPLPIAPKLSVADRKIDELHIHDEFNLLGVNISADLYDGNGVFIFDQEIPEELIADSLVAIISHYGIELKDYDFAIDETSVDVIYSEGYTEEELILFLEKIKNAFIEKEISKPNLYADEAILVDDFIAMPEIAVEERLSYPLDKFSISLALSPLSIAKGFFYNADKSYYTYKGWSAELALNYKFNKYFAISLESGYSEYHDFNKRNLYQIPVVVSSDFYLPLGESERFSFLFGLGAGVSFTNLVDSLDTNWVGEAKAGFNYRLSDKMALNFRSTWRVTVPVKYEDRMNENTLLTGNNLIGVSYIF